MAGSMTNSLEPHCMTSQPFFIYVMPVTHEPNRERGTTRSTLGRIMGRIMIAATDPAAALATETCLLSGVNASPCGSSPVSTSVISVFDWAPCKDGISTGVDGLYQTIVD